MRLHPAPGTATERDLLLNNESPLKTAICELVDGTLVEKPMGWEESAIAVLIGHFLVAFAKPRRLGTVLGADGMLRLVPGLVRVPDVSYLARGKLTRYQRGGQRIPSVAADLAVEVISKSNTKAEIARKLDGLNGQARTQWTGTFSHSGPMMMLARPVPMVIFEDKQGTRSRRIYWHCVQ